VARIPPNSRGRLSGLRLLTPHLPVCSYSQTVESYARSAPTKRPCDHSPRRSLPGCSFNLATESNQADAQGYPALFTDAFESMKGSMPGSSAARNNQENILSTSVPGFQVTRPGGSRSIFDQAHQLAVVFTAASMSRTRKLYVRGDITHLFS